MKFLHTDVVIYAQARNCIFSVYARPPLHQNIVAMIIKIVQFVLEKM